MRKGRLSLVGPTVVHIYSRPIVAIAAIKQLSGEGWCNGRRSHGESQRTECGCDGERVKHHSYKLHASTAFVTLENIDFECALEKLSPGDAFSTAGLFYFIRRNLGR